MDRQFTYNVAIESSNFEVTIDPTKLKTSNEAQTKDNFTRKEEFALRMNEITRQLTSYVQNPVDVTSIAEQATITFLKEGDTQYESILGRTVEMHNNKLATLISKGELMKDGNRIFEAQLEIVDGVVNFKTGDNLFSTINSVNSLLLPVDNKGNVDIAQVKNISYSGSNNENFVITLQNENIIEGKIAGKSVDIKTSTIFKLRLSDDQKTNILKPTLAAIQEGKLDLPETEALINHLLGLAPDTDITSIDLLVKQLRKIAKQLEDRDESLWDITELDDFSNFARDIISGLNTKDNLVCKY